MRNRAKLLAALSGLAVSAAACAAGGPPAPTPSGQVVDVALTPCEQQIQQAQAAGVDPALDPNHVALCHPETAPAPAQVQTPAEVPRPAEEPAPAVPLPVHDGDDEWEPESA